MRHFRDRAEAGRLLAEQLQRYAGRDDVVVLALPRGGVPVGYEVALAVRQLDPARVIVAVPVASRETCDEFRDDVDEIVCLVRPEPFHAVALWYDDFTLIREASHGTHEFSRERARITQRLITEAGHIYTLDEGTLSRYERRVLVS